MLEYLLLPATYPLRVLDGSTNETATVWSSCLTKLLICRHDPVQVEHQSGKSLQLGNGFPSLSHFKRSCPPFFPHGAVCMAWLGFPFVPRCSWGNQAWNYQKKAFFLVYCFAACMTLAWAKYSAFKPQAGCILLHCTIHTSWLDYWFALFYLGCWWYCTCTQNLFSAHLLSLSIINWCSESMGNQPLWECYMHSLPCCTALSIWLKALTFRGPLKSQLTLPRSCSCSYGLKWMLTCKKRNSQKMDRWTELMKVNCLQPVAIMPQSQLALNHQSAWAFQQLTEAHLTWTSSCWVKALCDDFGWTHHLNGFELSWVQDMSGTKRQTYWYTKLDLNSWLTVSRKLSPQFAVYGTFNDRELTLFICRQAIADLSSHSKLLHLQFGER